MIKIYLIRHGLTETNKQQRFVGWSDVPLAPEGFLQVERLAERLAEKLAAEPIAGFYSSDLLRAKQTAEAIGNRLGLEPVTSLMLREINFGDWEMLTYDEISSGYGEELKLWFEDPYFNTPPRGENFTTVCLRFRSYIDEITAGITEGAFIIVSHGGAITSFLHYCRDGNQKSDGLWDLKLDNASISLVEKKAGTAGVYEMIIHNDIEHLEDINV